LHQSKRDVLPHGERIEQRTSLEQHTEFLQQPLTAGVPQSDRLRSIDPNRSSLGMQQAKNTFDQNRFSSTRAADDDEAFAAGTINLDTIEHPLIAKRFAEASYGNLLDLRTVRHRPKKAAVSR